MRLIDADELKRYINIYNIACGCNGHHQEEILKAIDDQPTVELSEEQQTGRWIQKTGEYGDYYECSVCGCEMFYIDKTDFCCPNCGAEMEEKE